MADQSNKAAAQAQSAKNAAKAQRTEDGKQAMLDYESEMAATRAKTERLRALRLAREAATPPPPAKAPARKKAAAKTGKGSSGTLSQWLDQQEKSGRKS